MSEIKLILTKLKIVSEEKENGMYLCDKEHSKILLDYIQQKENEIKNVKNKAEHYKDVLRQIIHYCNYLRNDHKYSLNDGHIRKIKKICEREVGADDKI